MQFVVDWVSVLDHDEGMLPIGVFLRELLEVVELVDYVEPIFVVEVYCSFVVVYTVQPHHVGLQFHLAEKLTRELQNVVDQKRGQLHFPEFFDHAQSRYLDRALLFAQLLLAAFLPHRRRLVGLYEVEDQSDQVERVRICVGVQVDTDREHVFVENHLLEVVFVCDWKPLRVQLAHVLHMR
eukprot:CAMPEP_0116897628 /NCGR_PEP_ID=MMETSP0467-20121206/6565_1 /TAXON_ID=283647 /ORGANISM="Mesodinium pulex, Strain SPMC105" /LENGTH=180 /DNA_ID=CAMNT_0004569375 /DNA_START=178 /DNA_END=720 /DNA_ORIENTATION=-